MLTLFQSQYPGIGVHGTSCTEKRSIGSIVTDRLFKQNVKARHNFVQTQGAPFTLTESRPNTGNPILLHKRTTSGPKSDLMLRIYLFRAPVRKVRCNNSSSNVGDRGILSTGPERKGEPRAQASLAFIEENYTT